MPNATKPDASAPSTPPAAPVPLRLDKLAVRAAVVVQYCEKIRCEILAMWEILAKVENADPVAIAGGILKELIKMGGRLPFSSSAAHDLVEILMPHGPTKADPFAHSTAARLVDFIFQSLARGERDKADGATENGRAAIESHAAAFARSTNYYEARRRLENSPGAPTSVFDPNLSPEERVARARAAARKNNGPADRWISGSGQPPQDPSIVDMTGRPEVRGPVRSVGSGDEGPPGEFTVGGPTTPINPGDVPVG